MRKYYLNNKEKVKQWRLQYRIKNKDKIALCNKIWYQKNKDKLKTKRSLYAKNYRIKNKEKLRLYNQAYINKRLQIDINFKIGRYLRNRLNRCIQHNSKSGSAVKDLGCSIEQLKTYIESKFKPNMNWNNYGQWHIDHIIPLSSFDLTKREAFLKACHYTNLQPLWAEENLRKGRKKVAKSAASY